MEDNRVSKFPFVFMYNQMVYVFCNGIGLLYDIHTLTLAHISNRFKWPMLSVVRWQHFAQQMLHSQFYLKFSFFSHVLLIIFTIETIFKVTTTTTKTGKKIKNERLILKTIYSIKNHALEDGKLPLAIKTRHLTDVNLLKCHFNSRARRFCIQFALFREKQKNPCILKTKLNQTNYGKTIELFSFMSDK